MQFPGRYVDLRFAFLPYVLASGLQLDSQLDFAAKGIRFYSQLGPQDLALQFANGQPLLVHGHLCLGHLFLEMVFHMIGIFQHPLDHLLFLNQKKLTLFDVAIQAHFPQLCLILVRDKI